MGRFAAKEENIFELSSYLETAEEAAQSCRDTFFWRSRATLATLNLRVSSPTLSIQYTVMNIKGQGLLLATARCISALTAKNIRCNTNCFFNMPSIETAPRSNAVPRTLHLPLQVVSRLSKMTRP